MGIGALATLGAQALPNLSVAVVDNTQFGETGHQRSHTGYTTDLAAVAAACGWATTTTAWTMDEVKALIQGFEPLGTCTSDYRESLLAQAELAPEAGPIVIDILKDHIELLEKGKFGEIQKRLKLSEGELQGALTFIKGLSPFPGRAYSATEPNYVVPDLLVKLKEIGRAHV